METNKKPTLSPPWFKYFREIEALFLKDPEVTVSFDEITMTLKLYVNNEDKAEALTRLLPNEKSFGSIVLTINVVPANNFEEQKIDLFRKAFDGNKAVSYITTVGGSMLPPINYIVFRNEVVQFFNDNLDDINGNYSTLYQEIAKDIFGSMPGIFFCTDKKD